MKIPRPRLGGPLEERDATLFLALASFMITARVPMGFVLLALGPAVVIAVQGLRRHAQVGVQPLRRLLVAMLVCSFFGALLHPAVLTAPNSFTTAVTVALVAAGALLTGRPRKGLARLQDGVYAGLLFHWAVSMAEALTGFKLLPLLYPGANTTVWVTSHRFYVTSLFPNYNDYSVAMTLLVGMVVSRILLRNRVSPVLRALRMVVVLTALFEITYMGSRGALLAVLVIIAILLVQSIRLLHPRAIGARTIVFSALLLAVVALGLATSPWLNDHSAAVRGTILQRVLGMMGDQWLEGLFGWGSYPSYQGAAARLYPDQLMDPHNMLLEICIWFGIPALLLWAACWWRAVRALLRKQHATDWRTVSSLVLLASYPLLGVVPSSTLRYYLVWVLTIVAIGWLGLDEEDGRRAVVPAAQEQQLTTI